MGQYTHRIGHRLLAFFMSMAVLLTIAVPSAPEVFAESGELPENIEMHFNVGADEPGVTASEDLKTAEYVIAEEEQSVRISFNMSLNKYYEEGQLDITIPFVGFTGREGEKYEMLNYSNFLSQINSDASMLILKEDRRKVDGTIVLTNKEATALHSGLDLEYIVMAATVKDGGAQEYKITVTDTHTGEDRSPEPITATFKTHIDSVRTYKQVDEFRIVNGQYPRWDATLEEKYHLSEHYGINEEQFNEMAKTNDFVSYHVETFHTGNQYYNCYLKDEPENDGEIVAASYMFTAKDTTPLEKETEGEHAGEWKYYGRSSNRIHFLILVKYPKASVGDDKKITNKITVTDVGVDGNPEDVAVGKDEVTSIWQEAHAIKPGDIWSVTKQAHTDPIGGLTMLQKGKDVPLSYDISGIGLTYKYSMYDGFTYPDGPYQIEVVDDAMYINGLGDDGLSGTRLTPDDFNYTGFKLSAKHDVVESVNLDNSVANKHSMPLADRPNVQVYVMTKESPNEWVFDQEVTNKKFQGTYDREAYYSTADGSEEFTFENKDKGIYRVKFVYPGANGDVEVKATITGVLKADGPNIKAAIDNIDKLNIANFQVFNWDGAMGFNKDHTWLNPNDASDIDSTLPGMKEDLIDLDVALYEGHVNDGENVEVTKRIPAQNNLKQAELFAGAAKNDAHVTYNTAEGRADLSYTMAAVYGGAPLKSNFEELMSLGILEAPKDIVFYDLLPEGVFYTGYEFNKGGSYSFSGDGTHYNWKKVCERYSGWVGECKQPDSVEVETDDNYKGTHRQMVKLTLHYSEPPICKVGTTVSTYESHYAFGTGIYLHASAEYINIRSSSLVNNMAAQFINKNDKPIEVKEAAVHEDDGTVYEDIKDSDGNNAFSDLNNDKDTKSQSVVGEKSQNSITIIYSATTLKKWIKADGFDASFKDFTQTYAGHPYTYKIKFFSNKGKARNVMIIDSIEEAYHDEKYSGLDHWKGKLYGVDLGEAKSQGFDKIKVYVNTTKTYTNKELSSDYKAHYDGFTPADLTEANGWQQVDPDTYKNWGDVKTIVFAFGEDVIFGEEDDLPSSVTVYLKMMAPEGVHEGQTKTTQVLAYNSPAYYSEKLSDLNTWKNDTTVANTVTIGVKSVKADIPAVKKIMTGTALPEGFKDTVEFTITPEGETPAPRTYSGGKWGDEIKSVKLDVTTGASSPSSADNGSMFFTEPTKVVDEAGSSVVDNSPYSYIIKEKAGTKKGVAYSKAQYRVEYEVSDIRKDVQYADDTELTLKETIWKIVDDDGTVLTTPLEASAVEFKNDYTPAPAEDEIPVVIKEITGDDRPEEKEFTFMITPYLTTADVPPQPEKTVLTITGGGEGSFGKVKFTKEGTYSYGIYEVAGTETGYTYDKDKAFVAVFYVKDHDGELKVDKVEKFSVELKDTAVVADSTKEADEFRFINDYTPKPSNAVAVPSVAKEYSGEPRPVDKEFTFVIKPVSGDSIPMPAKNEVSVKGLGSATFEGEMVYTSAGTYVYEITEKDIDPSIKGYTKDESVYTYTVTVVDNDGTLSASGVMTKDGEEASAVIFKNDYTPVETTLEVPAPEKMIEGEAPEEYTKEFTFVIEAETEGAPMPENTKVSVNGEGTADPFGNITFTKSGTYKYKVSEADLTEAHKGYTKDDSVYEYTVTVTDNDGELKAVSEISKDSKAAEKLTFKNRYTPKETSVSVPLVVKKVEGITFDETTSDGETFTFEITADEDATTGAEDKSDIPMPGSSKATVNGEGTATPFGDIVFTKAGTYVYRIFEDELDKSVHGYTIDKSVYIFTVVVKDIDGELSATTSLTKEGEGVEVPEFINKYKAEPCEAALDIEKKVTGAAPASDETYTFVLTADGKDEKVTVKGAGKASFDKRTYTEEGVYTYTIKEVKGKSSLCKYDSTVYTITDTVTDSKGVLVYDRKITAGGSAKKAVIFTNEYVEESRPDSSSGDSSEDSYVTDLSSIASSSDTDVGTDSASSSETSSDTSSTVSSTTSSETSSTGTGTSENPKTGFTAAIGINALLIPALIFVSKKRRDSAADK